MQLKEGNISDFVRSECSEAKAQRTDTTYAVLNGVRASHSPWLSIIYEIAIVFNVASKQKLKKTHTHTHTTHQQHILTIG